MTDLASLSAQLQEALALPLPPVAIRFTDAPVAGVAGPARPAAAGCQFWEQGARRAVLTRAADHAFCAIGVHTHNLSGAPASQAGELGEVLAVMQGLDYVRAAEVAAIPVRGRAASHVLYEPLAEASGAPAVVLLFAHAAQSLVITEALARVDGQVPAAMGRPACALVPQVENSAAAAMSLGCCGARAYLDSLSDDIALWGLPGARLPAYVAEIVALADANRVLSAFHRQRRLDIEAGASPSVKESLARLA